MIVLLVSLALLVVLTIIAYRQMLRQRQSIGMKWAALEAVLRRRHQLVGQLLQEIRQMGKAGQMAADSMLMAQRVAAGQQANVSDQHRSESIIGGSLKEIIGIAHGSPAFAALPQYRAWRKSLEEIEGELEANAQDYNAAVWALDRMLAMFPVSLIAGVLGFERAQAMDLDGLLATVQAAAAPQARPAAVWKSQPTPPGSAPTAASI